MPTSIQSRSLSKLAQARRERGAKIPPRNSPLFESEDTSRSKFSRVAICISILAAVVNIGVIAHIVHAKYEHKEAVAKLLGNGPPQPALPIEVPYAPYAQ